MHTADVNIDSIQFSMYCLRDPAFLKMYTLLIMKSEICCDLFARTDTGFLLLKLESLFLLPFNCLLQLKFEFTLSHFC